MRRAIETMLIVFADHELSPSTLALRIAASERSSLTSAFLAGVGVLNGYLLRSLSGAFELLHDAEREGATAAVTERVDHHQGLPGFGHDRAKGADLREDPRAALLRRALDGVMTPAQQRLVNGVVAAAEERALPPAGLRFVVAALMWAVGAGPQGGANLLLLSRMAGWTAHYLEELTTTPRRFRLSPTYLAKQLEA